MADIRRAITSEARTQAGLVAGTLGAFEVEVSEHEVAVGGELHLSTWVYRPVGVDAGPAVITRTPYGNAYWNDDGIFWASHGYHFVLQDCRGTASYFDEASDGAATVEWTRGQAWCDGSVAACGMSYMGFTAWAMAARCAESLSAVSVAYYSSDRVSSWYPGGSFGLDLALQWSTMQAVDTRSDTVTDDHPTLPTGASDGYLHLPPIEADVATSGQVVPFYRERLSHRHDDPHWAPLDFSQTLMQPTCPPTLLFGGWWDYQRQYLWEDNCRLRQAGVPNRFVIGPWMHGGGRDRHNLETLAWFDRYLRGRTSDPQSQFRVYVTGAEAWRDIAELPTPHTSATRWFLRGDGRLDGSPTASEPSTYLYDPSDPTPSIALSSFDPNNALPCDNKALETRPDVLLFTSDVLTEDLTFLGVAAAELWVSSTALSADFFVRITDVDENGVSRNVLDRLKRLEPDGRLGSDDPQLIRIELGLRAHVFKSGHRVRVQVSSGAFPFYARNLGGGEDLATSIRLVVARQTIWHDPLHASSVELQVLAAPDGPR